MFSFLILKKYIRVSHINYITLYRFRILNFRYFYEIFEDFNRPIAVKCKEGTRELKVFQKCDLQKKNCKGKAPAPDVLCNQHVTLSVIILISIAENFEIFGTSFKLKLLSS